MSPTMKQSEYPESLSASVEAAGAAFAADGDDGNMFVGGHAGASGMFDGASAMECLLKELGEFDGDEEDDDDEHAGSASSSPTPQSVVVPEPKRVDSSFDPAASVWEYQKPHTKSWYGTFSWDDLSAWVDAGMGGFNDSVMVRSARLGIGPCTFFQVNLGDYEAAPCRPKPPTTSGPKRVGVNPDAVPWQPKLQQWLPPTASHPNSNSNSNSNTSHINALNPGANSALHAGGSITESPWVLSKLAKVIKTSFPGGCAWNPHHLASHLSTLTNTDEIRGFMAMEFGSTSVVCSFCEEYVEMRWPSIRSHQRPAKHAPYHQQHHLPLLPNNNDGYYTNAAIIPAVHSQHQPAYTGGVVYERRGRLQRFSEAGHESLVM